MNIYERQKIHEICESIKEDLIIKSIEESEDMSEQEFLLTKKVINENIKAIERMLVEEGLYDYGKKIIEEEFLNDALARAKSINSNIEKRIKEDKEAFEKANLEHKKALYRALGLGAAGLGAAGYAAYDAMQPDEGMLDQAQEYIQSMIP